MQGMIVLMRDEEAAVVVAETEEAMETGTGEGEKYMKILNISSFIIYVPQVQIPIPGQEK